MGDYVTWDKMFYNLHFKQEAVAATVTSTFFFLITFLDDTFIRNIL